MSKICCDKTLKKTIIATYFEHGQCFIWEFSSTGIPKGTTCKIYGTEKTSGKWPRVKIYDLKYAIIKHLQYQ